MLFNTSEVIQNVPKVCGVFMSRLLNAGLHFCICSFSDICGLQFWYLHTWLHLPKVLSSPALKDNGVLKDNGFVTKAMKIFKIILSEGQTGKVWILLAQNIIVHRVKVHWQQVITAYHKRQHISLLLRETEKRTVISCHLAHFDFWHKGKEFFLVSVLGLGKNDPLSQRSASHNLCLHDSFCKYYQSKTGAGTVHVSEKQLPN